ncbi:MAG TPA: hypothetical protein ACHBY4_14400 [Arsenophonus apicola]
MQTFEGFSDQRHSQVTSQKNSMLPDDFLMRQSQKSTFNLNFVASWAVALSVFVGAGGAQCICARTNVSS